MIKKLLYLYHRRKCALSFKEAADWWVYWDTDYWKYHYNIAKRHARRMRAWK